MFFNRGVASSQAYSRAFDNKKPDELPEPLRTKALDWLSRKLDEAVIKFIDDTPKGDALRCCFYEFHYLPVLQALKRAIVRGVDVKIITDAKVNESTDKKGVFHESFPREANLRAIKDAKIPKNNIILREARKSNIQHNKFMVRLEGASRVPTQVWTGSTNISNGGIHGQTNVGHWLRNEDLAERFLAYWELLKKDPGDTTEDDQSTVRTKNAEFRKAVEDLGDLPASFDDIQPGVTPVFSPRTKLDILGLYFDLVREAAISGCITLAFGVGDDLKKKLKNNTADNALVFLLLEKEDKPKKNDQDPFIALNFRNNVYSAWGSFLGDSLYQWTRETNAALLGLNSHVAYIHSKFLLRDPLGEDPIVVTGSANFSEPSTNANDENMLIIRGDHRVADIYFTEFNRLFNHYYFRAVHESTTKADDGANLFLKETADEWLPKYKPGLLRAKRLALYTGMEDFSDT